VRRSRLLRLVNCAHHDNALASFRGIFLVYDGETSFMHEETKFIWLRLWRNRLEAYPTDVFQGEQHGSILGPMRALSIQENHEVLS
jgi:hypothetical protein